MIVVRKIQVTMKTFTPQFFNHFSLSLNRKKNCGNESLEEKTTELNIHASVASLLNIRTRILIDANADNAKMKQILQ